MSFDLWGEFFGYPKCCRDFFTHRAMILFAGKKDIIPDEYPLIGTGFIPCPVCVATYTDEELVQRISDARHCSIPFPQVYDTIEVDEEFMQWLTTKPPR